MTRRGWFFALLAAALASLLSACSLAGDVTPPPGFVTPTSQPAGTIESVASYPIERPSAARGATIFAERCAPCHGPEGDGDGAQAAQLPNPPAALSDPLLARNASPAYWFDVVTNGRLENFMPPFAEGLSPAERWDVVHFLYTLSATPESLEQGAALYQDNCARCHGPEGKGDGPDAPAPPPDLTEQAFMAERSQADFFGVMSKGLGQDMPGFEAALSEEERWAVAGFLRTLTFDAEPAERVETAAVTGQITNGTAGAAIPADLTVALHTFDSFQPGPIFTATVASDGSFEFDEVPQLPERALIASVVYQGQVYASEVMQADGTQPTLDLPLTIFETTQDPSALRIEQLHIIIDFGEGGARVGELFIFTNPGDRTVIGAAPGEPVIELPLPPGAEVVSFEGDDSGERYLQTPDGFADTASVFPGATGHQILVSYLLPYTSRLDYKQSFGYPVNSLNVVMADDGVRLTSRQLQDQGIRQVEGGLFRSFSGGSLAPGEPVEFSLSGGPDAAGLPGGLWIGAGALALALAGTGWWYRLTKSRDGEAAPAAESPYQVRELAGAIAALDDQYAAGKLPEGDYRRQREQLKRQALDLMK